MNDIERFMSHVSPEPTSGCWLIDTASNRRGYPRIQAAGKQQSANRAAWVLFRGPIPAGAWVLHKCDNRACGNPDHLYLGDHQQNVRDALERKRFAQGDRHPMRQRPELVRHGSAQTNAKLAEEDVTAIRAARAAGLAGATELARRYGVSRSTVVGLCAGRKWDHAAGPLAPAGSWAAPSQCKNGHDYPLDVERDHRGRRVCRECLRAKWRRAWSGRRAGKGTR